MTPDLCIYLFLYSFQGKPPPEGPVFFFRVFVYLSVLVLSTTSSSPGSTYPLFPRGRDSPVPPTGPSVSGSSPGPVASSLSVRPSEPSTALGGRTSRVGGRAPSSLDGSVSNLKKWSEPSGSSHFRGRT